MRTPFSRGLWLLATLLAVILPQTQAATVTAMVQRATGAWATNSVIFLFPSNTPAVINGGFSLSASVRMTVGSNGWASNNLLTGHYKYTIDQSTRDIGVVWVPDDANTYNLWSLITSTNVLFNSNITAFLTTVQTNNVQVAVGRAKLNFFGVTATNNAASNSIDVTITSSGGAGSGANWSVKTNAVLVATNPPAILFTNEGNVTFTASSNAAGAVVSGSVDLSVTNSINAAVNGKLATNGLLTTGTGWSNTFHRPTLHSASNNLDLLIQGTSISASNLISGGVSMAGDSVVVTTESINIGSGETVIGAGTITFTHPGGGNGVRMIDSDIGPAFNSFWLRGAGGHLDLNGGLSASNATANRVAVWNGSKNLTNSAGVDTTELEYLDGVTSGIQGQLDGKVDEQNGFATNLTANLLTNLGLTYLGTGNSAIVLSNNAATNLAAGAVNKAPFFYLDGLNNRAAVGTNAPDAVLSLRAASQAGQVLTIHDVTGFGYGGHLSGRDLSANYGGLYMGSQGANPSLAISGGDIFMGFNGDSRATAAMKVDRSSKFVGIGTTTPLAKQHTSNSVASAVTAIMDGGGSTNEIQQWFAGSGAARVKVAAVLTNGFLYPSNAASVTPTAAQLGVGGFATWNSNGFALWATWSTDGTTVSSKQLAP